MYSNEDGILKEHVEEAIEVLKKVLQAFHDKKYGEVINLVHESKIDDLEEYLVEYIQGTIELNDYYTFDEYGVDILVNGEPTERMWFFEYGDGRGFALEYLLSSNGEDMALSLILQLDFNYTENGLKYIFKDVDPQ